MAEKEAPPKKYGFQISAITPDFMGSVIKIYEEVVGETYSSQRFSEQVVFQIDEIKRDLIERGFHESRLGSDLNSHSKLEIRNARGVELYYFEFNPNLDSYERENKETERRADEMRQQFRDRTNEFLISSNLGSELKA